MSAAGPAHLTTGAKGRRDQCPDHVCVMGDRDGGEGVTVRAVSSCSVRPLPWASDFCVSICHS